MQYHKKRREILKKQVVKRFLVLGLTAAVTATSVPLPERGIATVEAAEEQNAVQKQADLQEEESKKQERKVQKEVSQVQKEAGETQEEASLPQVFGAEEETAIQTQALGEANSQTVSFDSTSTWDLDSSKDINLSSLSTSEVPAEGITLKMDVLIPDSGAAPDFSGSIKTVGVLRAGSNWDWVQSNTIPELTKDSFTEKVTVEGASYYKASVAIPFAGMVGANVDGEWNGSVPFTQAVTEAIAAVTVQFAGYQCDYSGEIAIANEVLEEASQGGEVTEVKKWDFEDGIEGWYYGDGWEYQYDGAANSSVTAGDGMLKAEVDYSANAEAGWSQMAIVYETAQAMALTGVNTLSMDFIYNPASRTAGSFGIKAYADEGIDTDVTVDEGTAEEITVDGTAMKKVNVKITFDPLTTDLSKFAIQVIGKNTDYKGAVYLDNVTFLKESQEEDLSIFVNSTVAKNDTTSLSVAGSGLTSKKKDGSSETTALPSSIKMADKNATPATAAVYAYLSAVGSSESMIYGHQNDTWHKAGSSAKGLTSSDTKDVTGSISGVVGIDTLSLVGNEYSAKRYNSEIAAATGAEAIDIEGLGEQRANVKAAALLTNTVIKEGAIVTLSSHMPNFSVVKENADYNEAADPTYAKYDFTGYSPNTLTGDVANEILPGGKYNEMFNAYLDLVADYAAQVNGPVLFRPFHENTGSWFWWGAAFCDAQTYKNIYRYTVEYLRDEKNVHNFIYEYGPGSEAASAAEYEARYPGDNYVDLVGFDMYNSDPKEDNSGWMKDFKNELGIVEQFAKAHGKLVAVTETGVASSTPAAGDNQTALQKSGNNDKDWYNEVMEIVSESEASYYLLWANFGEKDGFYTPYIKKVNEDQTLFGHEMLDNFISFYNDPRSIFADNQKGILDAISGISVGGVSDEATGYMTSPVSGKRILTETVLNARITGADANTKVAFVLHGDKVDKTLTAATQDGTYYSAKLDAATLKSLGEYVGTIELLINGKSADTINATFNIPEPAEDPCQIDGFENYYGVDSLLNKKWATNKASGNTITLSLSQEAGTVFEGDYSMKFAYEETSDGWAGATISKEVNWSNCNALQFYTIPDGKNQKVVIQLTANGTVYEAYLNQYDGYKNSTKPMKVTIPFSEFCQRDTAGNPKGGLVKDCSSVTSFGLWVNAIGDSPAVVDGKVSGTIYYDNITAIKTDLTGAAFTDPAEEPGNNDGDTTKPGGDTTKPGEDGQKPGEDDKNPGDNVTKPKKANQVLKVKKSFKKAYGSKPFSLKVKRTKGNGKITYKSSNTKAAKVSSKGKVTIKGTGRTVITVTAAATSKYNKKTVKVVVNITPKKQKASVKAVNGKKIQVKWKKDTRADGYQIQYCTSKKFKKNVKTVTISKKKTVKKTIGKLKKGKTYYVRVRSYKKVKVSGKTKKFYGSWSTVKKSGKIKK